MPATSTDRLQGLTASVAVKPPCKAVTTTAITLNGEQTVGGTACVSGDRVLVAITSGSVSNGIWVVDTGDWARARDFDGARDVVGGTVVLVAQPGAARFWQVGGSGELIPGSSSISIEQIDPSALYADAGNVFFDVAENYASGTVGWAIKQGRFSVEWFGASSSATAASNTAAIQDCIDTAPEGSVIYFPGRYQINDELVVNKSLTFMGPHPGPVYVRASYAGLKQTTAGKACFLLQATTSMYAFGQFGIIGMRFIGLSGEGPSDASFGVGFIRCDTAINAGDFHVRQNLFRDLSLRWFTTAIDLTGIAYLNEFHSNSITYCDTAVKIARGAASDVGGQTRFVGGFYGLNRVGLSLNRDSTAAGGDFGLHGVTVSENTEYGVMVDEEAILYTSPDCQFEANGIAGIYTEIAEANPNTSGAKTIGGKFLTNGADIWVDKTTTTFADGNFFFPFAIDGAYLGSTDGLKVTIPGGHSPLKSRAFSIGRNVAGLTNGSLTPSQISANFQGTWVRDGGVDLTFGASVTIDASAGRTFSLVATSNIAFAIANPTNPGYLQEITITILNASGGPLGAVTWGTAFKLAAWTSPANVFSRSISFRYNGTNWVEFSRTPADVPN